MSTFLPLKIGGWAFGEILTSGQMNQLNTDFPFALNGRDGGGYAPTSDLVINALTVSPGPTGDVRVAGSFFALTSAQVVGELLVGNAVVESGIDVTGGTTTDTLQVNGTANLADGATISGGALACEAGCVVNSAFTSNARAAFNDRILSNAGIRLRTQNLGTLSASISRSVDTADVFYIPDSIVSSLDFSIAEPTVTTPEDGTSMIVISHSVNSIVVKDPAGATLITLLNASGSPNAAYIIRVAGSWVLASVTIKP